MQIGEVAALAGVSTRTVRHYHHVGLLPEPRRLANGYRDYRVRDAVVLARVRRLAELGLSLDEIRDVLADDRGRDLREVLGELDADLARQQAELGARRARLASLLAADDLHPEATLTPELTPELTAVLRDVPTEGSRMAQLDREVLTLLDGVTGPDERAELAALLGPLTEPEALARGLALYARLDELADARTDDPRIPVLAADLAAHFPDEVARATAGRLGDDDGRRWLQAVTGELSAAQLEVIRRLPALLSGRGRC